MGLSITIAIVAFVIGAVIGALVIKSKMQQTINEKENALVRANTQLESYTNLGEIFQNIADNTINKTQDSLIQKHQTALEPFQKELKEFKEKVELLKNTGIENTAALKEKIDNLTKDSNAIKFKAEELTEALKVNAKGRGMFGEIVLEQILTSSGLINQNDDKAKGNYITQKGFRDLDNPTSKSNMPDAVVFFPEGNRHLIIDSKCPLNYFQEYVNENDDTLKEAHIKNFDNALNTMVEDLSSKYNNLDGLNTPEFKLMFIPLESCVSYVYDNQDLILKANKKNVIIVGPSSLLATLKIIREAWDGKNLSDNMYEVQNHAVNLYEKFCIFLAKMEGLQKNFNTLDTGFKDVFTTMVGPRGLINQFEKFKNLGINPNKQIDVKYLTTNEEIEEEALV